MFVVLAKWWIWAWWGGTVAPAGPRLRELGASSAGLPRVPVVDPAPKLATALRFWSSSRKTGFDQLNYAINQSLVYSDLVLVGIDVNRDRSGAASYLASAWGADRGYGPKAAGVVAVPVDGGVLRYTPVLNALVSRAITAGITEILFRSNAIEVTVGSISALRRRLRAGGALCVGTELKCHRFVRAAPVVRGSKPLAAAGSASIPIEVELTGSCDPSTQSAVLLESPV